MTLPRRGHGGVGLLNRLKDFFQGCRIILQNLIQVVEERIDDTAGAVSDGIHFCFTGRALGDLRPFSIEIGGNAVLKNVLQMPAQLNGPITVVVIGGLADFFSQAVRQLVAAASALEIILGLSEMQAAFDKLSDQLLVALNLPDLSKIRRR
jgi:hypothetical protein